MFGNLVLSASQAGRKMLLLPTAKIPDYQTDKAVHEVRLYLGRFRD